MIDWTAFREPVWNVFIIGWWLVMWSNYYTFYYVRLHTNNLSPHHSRRRRAGPRFPAAPLTHTHTHTRQIASYGSQTLGMSYSAASILVIIVNGVGFPFRVLVPLFSDRFGPLNVLIPVLFLWSVVAFCWLAVGGGVAGYYVWTAFYGALSASFQCLIPTTVTSITPRLDKVGTRMGMAFGIISFAAMTGPPVGGALQTAQGGGFTGAQVWAACATLVGAVLCFVARSFRAGGLNPKFRC